MVKKKKMFCRLILPALFFSVGLISCSDGDSGSSSKNTPNKPQSEDSEINEIESYNFSTIDYTQNLELKNYPYEVRFTVPVKDNETWEAKLSFDESDIPEGCDADDFYELGTLGETSGTGPGKFSLFVYENQNNGHHTASLSVNSSQATISKTITLAQIPGAENEDEDELDPKNGARRRMIGYGYDYTAGYASSRCIKNQILDVAQLTSEEGVTLTYGKKSQVHKIEFTNFSNDVDFREASGVNTAEIEVKLAADVSASYDQGGSFSAEIESHTEWSEKEEGKYQYGWADIRVAKYIASTGLDSDDIYNPEVLTPQAYKAINGLSRKYRTDYVDPINSNHTGIYNLIKDYGAYVVVGGELGGVANVTMQVEDENISGAFSTEAMLKLAYQGTFDASIEVNGEYKSTYTSNSNKFRFHSSVRGGGANEANELSSLLTNLDATASDRKDKSAEWKNSIKKNESVFLGFTKKEELIPIYDFVDIEEDGGDERRKAIYDYFETKLLTDFPEPESQGIYVKTDPSKFSVPDFKDSDSLIKDIKIGTGVMSVRACSEYIPEIDASKRVTVFYPADNNRVFWNRGLYLGDDIHPPHAISWGANGKLVCYPKECEHEEITVTDSNGKTSKKKKYRTPTTVYRFGTNLTYVDPGNYKTDSLTIVDTLPAEEYKELLGGKKRSLVKIGDCIFQRDYWDYDKFNDGTSIASVAKSNVYDEDFRNHANEDNIPIKGWIQKEVGEKVATSKKHTIGDGVYYPSNFYGNYHDSYGGLFPTGWTLPNINSMKELISRLEKITNKTEIGGNTSMAFLDPSILGLRIPKYGYISFWNGASYSFYSQEDYDKTAVFPIGNVDANGINYPDTHAQSYRIVANPSSSVQIVTHNLKHSGRDKSEDDDNHKYFISKRGPAYTLLLCQKIK